MWKDIDSGEFLIINSEKSFPSILKREYKYLFSNLCYRRRFNRTKRDLHAVIVNIRYYISIFMQSLFIDIRIIHSIPIFVCEFGKYHFNKCFKDELSYRKYDPKNKRI